MKTLINNEWLNNEAAIEGETILVTNGDKAKGGGYAGHTTKYKIVSVDELKATQERQWRDSELLRTDRFVVIPDYPTDLLTYRDALRNYPDQDGFPNGVRPSE